MGRGAHLALAMLWLIATGCAYNAQKRTAGWVVVETENVLLRTSVSEEKARQIARELQELRDLLAGSVLRCAFRGRPDRIQVTVLPTSEFYDVAPKGSEGLYRTWSLSWLPDYSGQIVLPKGLDSDTRQVYQHELVHHLVRACMPNAPFWIHEGLATLLQTAVIREGKLTIGLPAYAFRRHIVFPERGRENGLEVTEIRPAWILPVEDVVNLSQDAVHPERSLWGSFYTHQYYATSWLLVHLLELGAPDLHPRFVAYLSALRKGDADPQKLFAAHFADVDLRERMRAYIVRGKYPYLVLRTVAPSQPPPRLRSMSAGEAHLHWAWLWMGAAASEENRQHQQEHVVAAQAEPATRARAHLLDAIALVAKGDRAGAEREVEAGLRAMPDEPALLHAKVELLLAREADASHPAARLAAVARTADQLCAAAAAALASNDESEALRRGARGLKLQPSSRTCRFVVEQTRPTAAPESQPRR